MSTYHPLISRTTKAVDWLFEQDLEAADTESMRDELIADIAADKLKAKLAKLGPIDFLAAMESFTRDEAPNAFAMFLADPAGFRDLLVGKMIEQMKLDAEIEAIKAVEMLERDDRNYREAEYFCARFPMTWRSQCGKELGAGNNGVSHCYKHGGV